MPVCELTGKRPVVKNSVSHSNIKTKGKSYPNIQQKTVFSPTLNQKVCFKMSTSAIRSMEHVGGFDTYILNQPIKVLSPKALTVRGKILAKLSRKNKGAANETKN